MSSQIWWCCPRTVSRRCCWLPCAENSPITFLRWILAERGVPKTAVMVSAMAMKRYKSGLSVSEPTRAAAESCSPNRWHSSTSTTTETTHFIAGATSSDCSVTERDGGIWRYCIACNSERYIEDWLQCGVLCALYDATVSQHFSASVRPNTKQINGRNWLVKLNDSEALHQEAAAQSKGTEEQTQQPHLAAWSPIRAQVSTGGSHLTSLHTGETTEQR